MTLLIVLSSLAVVLVFLVTWARFEMRKMVKEVARETVKAAERSWAVGPSADPAVMDEKMRMTNRNFALDLPDEDEIAARPIMRFLSAPLWPDKDPDVAYRLNPSDLENGALNAEDPDQSDFLAWLNSEDEK
jgi:hypothetical protein